MEILRVPVKFEYPYAVVSVLQVYLELMKSRSTKSVRTDESIEFEIDREIPKIFSKLVGQKIVRYTEYLIVKNNDMFTTTSTQTIPLLNIEIDSILTFVGENGKTTVFGTIKATMTKRWKKILSKPMTTLTLKTFKAEREEELNILQKNSV